jgi:hypothetical protein
MGSMVAVKGILSMAEEARAQASDLGKRKVLLTFPLLIDF